MKTPKTKKTVTKTNVETTPSVISDAEVQTCLEHLKAIGTVLAPYAVTLTTAERRATTKLRKGGATVIPLLGRLAASAGVEGNAVDVDAMQKHLDMADALLPVLTTAKALSDSINDTVLSANSQAWGPATTLHGVLKRVAKTRPDMRRDMEVVSAAFAVRKRTTAKPAEGAKTTSETPASEPAPAPAEATPAPHPTTTA